MNYMKLVELADINKSDISANFLRSHFKQILSGLEFMHQHGIAHNDIKLGNILLYEK